MQNDGCATFVGGYIAFIGCVVVLLLAVAGVRPSVHFFVACIFVVVAIIAALSIENMNNPQ